ncbi:hypothetical protein GOV11_05190 [Candidatus Woesearchaeota archaeon]|nr:hypothetical protein [Candidatus Woesearchaeota archaeon]
MVGNEDEQQGVESPEEFEAVQKDFEQAIDLAKQVKSEIEVKDHVAKDENDKCGYCGQHFGPDDIVVEKEIYGRKWKFCDENCYKEFMDASNFKDENLDAEQDTQVNIKKQD